MKSAMFILMTASILVSASAFAKIPSSLTCTGDMLGKTMVISTFMEDITTTSQIGDMVRGGLLAEFRKGKVTVAKNAKIVDSYLLNSQEGGHGVVQVDGKVTTEGALLVVAGGQYGQLGDPKSAIQAQFFIPGSELSLVIGVEESGAIGAKLIKPSKGTLMATFVCEEDKSELAKKQILGTDRTVEMK